MLASTGTSFFCNFFMPTTERQPAISQYYKALNCRNLPPINCLTTYQYSKKELDVLITAVA